MSLLCLIIACTDMGVVIATVESTADDTAITDQMKKDKWISLNTASLSWIADSSDPGSYTSWYGSNL